MLHVAPSSGEPLSNLNLPFKWILGGLRLFSDVWSENAALFFFFYDNSFKSTNTILHGFKEDIYLGLPLQSHSALLHGIFQWLQHGDTSCPVSPFSSLQ